MYQLSNKKAISPSKSSPMLPTHIGNRAFLSLIKESTFGASPALTTDAPIQRVWLKFNDSNILRADEAINGLLWYYDTDNHEMWYKIVKRNRDIPELIINYQGKEKKRLYENWKELGFYDATDFDSSVDSNPSGSQGRFGMELECIPPSVHSLTLDLEHIRKKSGKEKFSPVNEADFKGVEIFSVADRKASMTLDSRTGYDEKDSTASVVPELIFNSSKISMDDDLEHLGELIVQELGEKTLGDFLGEKNIVKSDGTSFFMKVNVSSPETAANIKFKDITRFNIHITVAMPLNTLWDKIIVEQRHLSVLYCPLSPEIKDSLDGDDQLSSSSKAFLGILLSLFKSAQYYPDATADPKQHMGVMNRTSFGKMFTLLKPNEQTQVLKFLESDSSTPTKNDDMRKLTKDHPITMNEMYTFFNDISTGEKTSMDDPTYMANHGAKAEKLGVSHLGDKVEKVGTPANSQDAPILEFRHAYSMETTLNNLPDYLRRIQDDMRLLLKNSD